MVDDAMVDDAMAVNAMVDDAMVDLGSSQSQKVTFGNSC